MDITNHWRYFLSLESEFNTSLRYVEYTKEQESVFSFEFARLLMLICSEMDVLFKVICDHINNSANADSIGKYYGVISTKYDITSEKIIIDRYGLKLFPFEDWNQDTPPSWWTAYNKVKHRRHEHFSQANLGNVLQTIAGLFVLNLIALNEYSLISKIFNHPSLLDRDVSPGALMLETSYKVKLVTL